MIFPDFIKVLCPKINRVYLSIYTAQILFCLCGCSISWTSPTIPKLFNITTSPVGRAISVQEASWISSLMTLGGALGPFVFGYSAKKLGKKRTLLASGVPFVLSFIAMAFADLVEILYVARFVNGIAVGGAFTTGSNYVIELTNKDNRGILSSISSITVTFGMLFTYCLGPYLDVMAFNLVLAGIAFTFLVVFSLVAAECPIYYVNRDNEEKAKTIIEIKQGSCTKTEIDLELQQIKTDISQEESDSILQLFKSPSLTKLFFIAISLFIVQQLCGGIFIQYYSQSIFEMTGTSLPPEICAMIVGGSAFLSSFITPCIIERIGRKKMIVISCLGMSVTHIPVGLYIYLTEQGMDTSALSFVPILTMALNILVYSNGAGPIPWIMQAELFPQRVKISATSLITSFNWCFSFMMTYSFGFFMYTLGLAASFWFFGICCFVFAIYCHIVVPETKGKSLAELHIDLTKK